MEIILISSYPEVTELSKKLAREINLNVTILESALDEAVEVVKRKLNHPAETILISRPATANLLIREYPGVRVLPLEITEYDLIKALYQAKQTGKKVGVIGSADETSRFDIDYISKLLNMNFITYWYVDSLDFSRKMEQTQKDGIELIIGGGNRGLEFCKERGVENIGLNIGETTIYQTFRRVAEIINTQKREIETFEFVRTVVELSNDAIAAVDQNHNIVVFNKKAANIFHIPETEAQNKSLESLKFRKSFKSLIEGSPNSKGEIHNVNGNTLLVKRVPFVINGENKGIIVTFQDVSQIQESEKHIRRELFLKGFVAKFTFDDIIHRSDVMKRIIEKAKKFSKVDSNVLIIGESGTGKELMAQSIHNAHPERKLGPFVAINCAALTDSLLESELFGYEKGTFTGANKEGKSGLFELAHKGTIFLDEIGKVSLEMQSKLLRVLQEREVRRIGGERNIPIDVRVIAAANEDIRKLTEQNKFRSDLFYRLEILSLYIPPLRNRKEDIPLLIEFMLQKCCSKYNKKFKELSDFFNSKIFQFNWPGNIRQLENTIERAVVLTDSESEIDIEILQLIHENFEYQDNEPVFADIREIGNNHVLQIPLGTLDEMQRFIVKQLINQGYITKNKLALELGISRTTLWKLLSES